MNVRCILHGNACDKHLDEAHIWRPAAAVEPEPTPAQLAAAERIDMIALIEAAEKAAGTWRGIWIGTAA